MQHITGWYHVLFLLLNGWLITMSGHALLTHSALEAVPAAKGSNVQLRCGKIMESQYSDMILTNKTWKKNSNKIDTSKFKYKVTSVVTYDYCENFKQTSEIMKSFGPIVHMNVTYGSGEMKCYTSVLHIQNIQDSDFGIYSCNLSSYESDVKEITLFNEAETQTKSLTGIQFFEHFYIKGLKDKLLLQCSVFGGSVKWMFYETSPDCIDYVVETAITGSCSKPVSEIESTDMWRCFNFTVKSHTPYAGVAESFMFVENICGIDNSAIGCAIESDGFVVGKSDKIVYIIENWGYRNFRYLDYGIYIFISLCSILPVVGLILLIAGIIACVRSRMCCRSGRRKVLNMPPLHP